MTLSATERLTALNARERTASEFLIRLNAEKETKEKEVQELASAAIEAFGTDDLEVLRANFRQADRRNTELLDNYEAALDAMQDKLAALKNVGA